MVAIARMRGKPDVAWWMSTALVATALVATVVIDRQFLSGSHGRRLGGDSSPYDGAVATLSELWDKDGGPVRLLVSAGLVLVLGSLAAGAGVGGGGLFVPIYWLVLGAGPKGAVPLSKATILGGAVGNFLSLGFQRHPKADRPMIDYEASTFMQSGELLGVVFGVLLNKLLPAILIILFLIAILGWNAFRTIKKARVLRAKETAAFAKAASTAIASPVATAVDVASQEATVTPETPTPERDAESGVTGVPAPAPASAGGSGGVALNSIQVEPLGNGLKPTEPSPPPSPPSTDKEAEPSAELAAILKAESAQFPRWAWALLAVMTAYTLSYSFISKAIQRDPNCQQWSYWLWSATPRASCLVPLAPWSELCACLPAPRVHIGGAPLTPSLPHLTWAATPHLARSPSD